MKNRTQKKATMDQSTGRFLIREDSTIKEAMKQCSAIGQKQIFVTDRSRRLIGALSDGDIRRHILNGGLLSNAVEMVCNKRPICVYPDFSLDDIRQKMLKLKIESIPVITREGIVMDVLVWDKVFAGNVKPHKEPLNVQVVVMAGGKGSRLEPFTKVLPKPLIPIGDKTVIEHIMDSFHEHAVKDFFISLNYKAGVIRAYLTDSAKPYKITFIQEKSPLGTAGALKMMRKFLRDPFIVINCDVLMNIDYVDLLKAHRDGNNDLTLVTCWRHYVIPYGVCEIDSRGRLHKIIEKPEQDLLVNTGLYVMSPKILPLIPAKKKFDMDELFDTARKNKMRIGVFPVSEKAWQDVGQWEEIRKLM